LYFIIPQVTKHLNLNEKTTVNTLQIAT